ncbi:C-type lectin domain family 17, member A-like isoform X2 [Onychostoma macrolepis]|uniref:C-type lectin domain family 17, member A-like isoform X2 n=1 Tax=Onychostoma macrolepis TaxID=369639 RepID=UPI00272AF63C|nr:C-type lectin domain family 17, member A-like isoform X2 [Onychostoma macrolepis]
MSANIHSNIIPRAISRSAHKDINYSNDLDWIINCEVVRNCSDQEKHVGHNARIEQFLHKDMENRSQAHHCPQKNFPEKWVQKNGTFYVFSSDKKDWNSSRQRCQDLGGDLVVINSREEQNHLAEQIHAIGVGTLYWIGLTDSHTEGVWLWVDDTKDHLNFWARPPDDHKSADNPLGEDCVVLNGRMFEAKWGDVFCLRKERSICEILCSN